MTSSDWEQHLQGPRHLMIKLSELQDLGSPFTGPGTMVVLAKVAPAFIAMLSPLKTTVSHVL